MLISSINKTVLTGLTAPLQRRERTTTVLFRQPIQKQMYVICNKPRLSWVEARA